MGVKRCFQEGMNTEREDPTSEEARVQEDCWSGKAFDVLISYQMHLPKVQSILGKAKRRKRCSPGAGSLF